MDLVYISFSALQNDRIDSIVETPQQVGIGYDLQQYSGISRHINHIQYVDISTKKPPSRKLTPNEGFILPNLNPIC